MGSAVVLLNPSLNSTKLAQTSLASDLVRLTVS